MEDTSEEFIPVEMAAAILGVTTRHVSRYQDRVRTKRLGKRILYHRDDIATLAAERSQIATTRATANQTTDASLADLIALLHEKDTIITQQQEQLPQLTQRLAVLEAQQNR